MFWASEVAFRQPIGVVTVLLLTSVMLRFEHVSELITDPGFVHVAMQQCKLQVFSVCKCYFRVLKPKTLMTGSNITMTTVDL